MSNIQKEYWNIMARNIPDRVALNHWVDENGDPLNEILFEEIANYILNRCNHKNTGSILEVGCGNGLILERPRSKLDRNWTIFGTDVSDEMVKMANIEGVKVFCSDASDIHHLNAKTFDLIYLHSVVQYFDNDEYFNKVILECNRLLKEDGILMLMDVPIEWYKDYMRTITYKTKILLYIKSKFPSLVNLYKRFRKVRNLENVNGVELVIPSFEGYYTDPDFFNNYNGLFEEIKIEVQQFKYKPLIYRKFRFNFILIKKHNKDNNI